MSWNIKTPGDYINGPLTVAGATSITGNLTVGGSGRFQSAGSNWMEFSINVLTSNQATGANIRSVISTAANPTYSWTGDLDTGLFNDSANSIGFAIGGSEGMRLNSTGLKIGTTSNQGQLTVGVGSGLQAGTTTSVAHALYDINYASTGDINTRLSFVNSNGATNAAIDRIGNPYFNDSGNLSFLTKAGAGSLTERMRITADGNIGIGIIPSAWATTTTVWRALDLQYSCGLASSGAGSGEIDLLWNAYYDQTDQRWEFKYTGDRASRYAMRGSGIHAWFNTSSAGTVNNPITWDQVMTLDASGNLCLGTTSLISNAKYSSLFNGNATYGIELKTTATSGTSYFVNFFNSSTTQMGYISGSGTTITYGTTSDYRLKEDVQPLTGALGRIAALKPSIYKWKVDGSYGEGFIAHELAAVVPLAVVGEKDAVNKDGSVKPQAVDLSKVVPVLVAAIQELTARVVTLENA